MYKIILRHLKELQADSSVSAFARHLEMPQKTVDAYINGQRKPSVEFILRVCAKCHVTSDWLLGLSDARTRENEVAPLQVLPKFRQSKQADVTDELAAIRQQLARQEMEIAALKELNKPTACCG